MSRAGRTCVLAWGRRDRSHRAACDRRHRHPGRAGCDHPRVAWL